MNQPSHPEALAFALYKPAGPTSFDVVHAVKKILGRGQKKIGHFGTLDPFAEGLIIVGTAGATKLADRFHLEFPKTYLAHGVLGVQMDTGDLTGDQIKSAPIKDFSLEQWQAAASAMVGVYMQSPPAYSATKHEGKALYEYARKGIVIEKPAVRREIYKFEVLNVSMNRVEFRAEVSSGTYIRTLFEDLCLKLDNVGHLISLKRESVGNLNAPASMGELKAWSKADLEAAWLPFDNMLQLPEVALSGRDLTLFSHGQHLTRPQYQSMNGEVWVIDTENRIIAMGDIQEGVLRSKIMFAGGSPSSKQKLTLSV